MTPNLEKGCDDKPFSKLGVMGDARLQPFSKLGVMGDARLKPFSKLGVRGNHKTN